MGANAAGDSVVLKKKTRPKKHRKEPIIMKTFAVRLFFGGGLLVCGVRSGKIDQLKQV